MASGLLKIKAREVGQIKIVSAVLLNFIRMGGLLTQQWWPLLSVTVCSRPISDNPSGFKTFL